MNDITVCYHDDVYVKIKSDRGIAQEIQEQFSFYVPGYKYNPKFKLGMWDGRIKLFNLNTRLIYAGLVPHILQFCTDNEYSVGFENATLPDCFPKDIAQRFVGSLGIPERYAPRDYQLDTFLHCINHKRALFVSPTASGKSMIIYLVLAFLARKTLIIVPRLQLIHQMAQDFADYGFASEANVHKVYEGQSKDTDKPIVLTTWQSAYKMPPEWFAQFEVIIGDEAHNFKATSLTDIMGKTTQTKYKFGFTGSLDDSKTHRMVLEGLFGPHQQLVSTKDLMDQGYISDLEINSLVLRYPDAECKALRKQNYATELDYIVSHSKRNAFVRNLALSREKNTLILCRFVDKQCKPLFEQLSAKTDRPVYLVHGKVEAEDREIIRNIVNEKNDAIIVATTGCFSEGINIPNIHNIILPSPSKSRILIMQMIGRGLSKTATKDRCSVFDIADDLSWKTHKNHTLRHWEERVRYYNEESFNYRVYKIDL